MGRRTIARVLKALVGVNNVMNPTLGTLARPLGLSSLINKPVAIFPVSHLPSRPDNAAIVECLLSISGEDGQTIDREHLDAWTGRLPTRSCSSPTSCPDSGTQAGPWPAA